MKAIKENWFIGMVVYLPFAFCAITGTYSWNDDYRNWHNGEAKAEAFAAVPKGKVLDILEPHQGASHVVRGVQFIGGRGAYRTFYTVVNREVSVGDTVNGRHGYL